MAAGPAEFPRYRGLAPSYRGNNLHAVGRKRASNLIFYSLYGLRGRGVGRRSSQVVAERHAGVPDPAGWDCGFPSVGHDVGDRLPPHREDWTFSRRLLVTPVPWVSLVGHSRTCRTIPISIASGMSGDGCLLLYNCKTLISCTTSPDGREHLATCREGRDMPW